MSGYIKVAVEDVDTTKKIEVKAIQTAINKKFKCERAVMSEKDSLALITYLKTDAYLRHYFEESFWRYESESEQESEQEKGRSVMSLENFKDLVRAMPDFPELCYELETRIVAWECMQISEVVLICSCVLKPKK